LKVKPFHLCTLACPDWIFIPTHCNYFVVFSHSRPSSLVQMGTWNWQIDTLLLTTPWLQVSPQPSDCNLRHFQPHLSVSPMIKLILIVPFAE
jgi:hypothetical protein